MYLGVLENCLTLEKSLHSFKIAEKRLIHISQCLIYQNDTIINVDLNNAGPHEFHKCFMRREMHSVCLLDLKNAYNAVCLATRH